jgi:hypothetical protein
VCRNAGCGAGGFCPPVRRSVKRRKSGHYPGKIVPGGAEEDKCLGCVNLEIMIHTSIKRVHPDKVELLRAWFAEGTRRADEVRETFRQEGVRHEQAYLINTSDGTLLVYSSELGDFDRA